MLGRLGWFLLGVAGGVLVMSIIKRTIEEEDQDFDSIADELTKRFSNLEEKEAN